jgi:hypothetical protein
MFCIFILIVFMPKKMTDHPLGYKYLNDYSEKERQIIFERYNAGTNGIQIRRATGVVKQVIKNQYGTIFTLENKKYVFKYLKNLDISIGSNISVLVIYEEGANELFVINNKEYIYCIIQ